MKPDLVLDAEVRRVDEDRWLASRFAPVDARARLIAIYTLNHEIARTAQVVTQAAIGDIRLQWWRDALAEVFDGKQPRAHPVVAAFAVAHAETPFARDVLDALIQARGNDLDAAPFRTWADVEAYADATAGGVMRLAIVACGSQLGEYESFTKAAARAWGLVSLLRAAPALRERGRSVLPVDEPDPHVMLERARAAYAQARALGRGQPSAIFAATGYVALTPLYISALAAGRFDVNLLRRQFKLVASAAAGAL